MMYLCIGELMMFFGCRSEASDYFFKTEWERLSSDGKLILFNAFSRDQVFSYNYYCKLNNFNN